MKTLGIVTLGLLLGFVAGLALLDRGPGVELGVFAMALAGAIVAALGAGLLRGGMARR